MTEHRRATQALTDLELTEGKWAQGRLIKKLSVLWVTCVGDRLEVCMDAMAQDTITAEAFST